MGVPFPPAGRCRRRGAGSRRCHRPSPQRPWGAPDEWPPRTGVWRRHLPGAGTSLQLPRGQAPPSTHSRRLGPCRAHGTPTHRPPARSSRGGRGPRAPPPRGRQQARRPPCGPLLSRGGWRTKGVSARRLPRGGTGRGSRCKSRRSDALSCLPSARANSPSLAFFFLARVPPSLPRNDSSFFILWGRSVGDRTGAADMGFAWGARGEAARSLLCPARRLRRLAEPNKARQRVNRPNSRPSGESRQREAGGVRAGAARRAGGGLGAAAGGHSALPRPGSPREAGAGRRRHPAPAEGLRGGTRPGQPPEAKPGPGASRRAAAEREGVTCGETCGSFSAATDEERGGGAAAV